MQKGWWQRNVGLKVDSGRVKEDRTLILGGALTKPKRGILEYKIGSKWTRRQESVWRRCKPKRKEVLLHPQPLSKAIRTNGRGLWEYTWEAMTSSSRWDEWPTRAGTHCLTNTARSLNGAFVLYWISRTQRNEDKDYDPNSFHRPIHRRNFH